MPPAMTATTEHRAATEIFIRRCPARCWLIDPEMGMVLSRCREGAGSQLSASLQYHMPNAYGEAVIADRFRSLQCASSNPLNPGRWSERSVTAGFLPL
jgi:hypothetical protein